MKQHTLNTLVQGIDRLSAKYPDYEAIDREVAESTPCPVCGQNCQYYHDHRNGEKVALCPGHYEVAL